MNIRELEPRIVYAALDWWESSNLVRFMVVPKGIRGLKQRFTPTATMGMLMEVLPFHIT